MRTIEPGQTVGPYNIIYRIEPADEVLTFKAYSVALARDVILKIIAPSPEQRQQLGERFGALTRMLVKLQHPHIETVEEVGEADELFYLAVRDLATSTLAERLRVGPLSLADAVKIIAQLAAALDHAHKQGVRHGLLNPDHILIDANGNAYLTELGIHEVLTDLAAKRAASAHDQHTDIAGLGNALYMMLTGRALDTDGEGETLGDVLQRHVDALPLPTQLKPRVRAAFEQIIAKAMSRVSSERFASAADLLAALQQARELSNIPITTTAPTATPLATPSVVMEREREQEAVRQRRAAEMQTRQAEQQRLEAEARVKREALEREAAAKLARTEAEARAHREEHQREAATHQAQIDAAERAQRAAFEREQEAARARAAALEKQARADLEAKQKATQSASHAKPVTGMAALDAKREEVLRAAREAQAAAEKKIKEERSKATQTTGDWRTDLKEAEQRARESLRQTSEKLTLEQQERLRVARQAAKAAEELKRKTQATASTASASPKSQTVSEQGRKEQEAAARAAHAARPARRGGIGIAQIIVIIFLILCVGLPTLCIGVGLIAPDTTPSPSRTPTSTRTPTPTRTPVESATQSTEAFIAARLTAAAATSTAAARASGTARPTNTATRVVSTPTTRPSPSATPTIAAQLVFSDDFKTGDCNLPEGDNDNRTVKCENGEYRILNKTEDARWFYYPDAYTDVVIEVDARYITGTASTEYGVVFRVSDDGKSLYGFTVTRNGRYQLFRYQNGEFTNLQFPFTSSAISSDRPNRLRIVAQGNRLTASVNGTAVQLTVSDSTFTRGAVGLFIRSAPGAQVAFSNLRVSTLSPIVGTPTRAITPTRSAITQPTATPTR